MMYGAGDLRIDEELFDLGTLGATEIFVKTEFSGLSTGTDLGNFEGRSTEVPGAPDYPRPVGYSNVGIVAAVGQDVSKFRVGDRVFGVKAHRSAYVAKEDEFVIPVPAGVAADQASLGYLVHLGVVSLRQAHYQAGENVAVVGLGIIGLATISVARAMGARVIAVSNSEQRAELARRMGALDVLMTGDGNLSSVFGGVGADIVVNTANSWGAWQDSMELARYCGRVTVLGFPGRAQEPPPFNPLDARWLYAKQLSINGSGFLPKVDCSPSEIRFNLRRNLQYVLDLMAQGSVDLAPAISHRFPYQRMREAYELAAQRAKDFSAAVFDWREASTAFQRQC